MVAILLALASAATPGDVELYAAQPTMVGASLSPDGTRLAFLSSIDGRYHLVIERFRPEFERHILAPNDQMDFDWVGWANDDRLILSASYSSRRHLTDTAETRLFSVDSSGKDLRPIIRPNTFKETGSRVAKEGPPPQVQDNVIDWLADEPNHVLVALDADFDGFDEVRRVDVRDGRYEVELGDFAGARNWITDPSGRIRLGWGYEDEDLAITIEAADGTWPTIKNVGWLLEGFVPIGFRDSSSALLVMGPGDSGRRVVREVDLDSGEFTRTIFEHERVDADHIVFDSTSGVPVGVRYVEHLPVIEYFDDDYARLQASVDRALPDTSNRIVSTSADRRQLLVFASSGTNAGSYYLWDRETKSLGFYSDYIRNLDEEALSPVKAVSYTARDGLEIPAYLTLPRGAEASGLPAVILPHGGPRLRDDMQYHFLSQYIASRGYAVLRPNFRGSDGYGRVFADAGLSEWGGKMQDDVTDGAEWLIDAGIADPARLCIVGWSYGGYAAAMGAVKTPSLYQCAASINGVLNLPLHISQDVKYIGGREWTRHMGLEGESSKTVSPYHQAERLTVPMLIIQAEDDPRVHKEQGRSMAKRLQQLDKKVDYIEIEFGGHSVRNFEGRSRILEALGVFLDRHIGSGSR